jgi:hypothetical protein
MRAAAIVGIGVDKRAGRGEEADALQQRWGKLGRLSTSPPAETSV